MLSLRGPASHDVILETGLLTEGVDWARSGFGADYLATPRSAPAWACWPRLPPARGGSRPSVGRARSRFCAERIRRPGLVLQSNRGKTRMRFRESAPIEAITRGWRPRLANSLIRGYEVLDNTADNLLGGGGGVNSTCSRGVVRVSTQSSLPETGSGVGLAERSECDD